MNFLALLNVVLYIIAPVLFCFLFFLHIYDLAKNKRMFIAIIPVGKIMAIMVRGKFFKFIGEFPGHWLNPKTGEIVEIADMTEEQKNEMNSVSFFERFLQEKFGVCWIGFCSYLIYSFRFKWNEWEKKTKKSDYELIAKDEKTDFLYFRFWYAFEIMSKTKDGKITSLTAVLNIKICNAEKAVFGFNNNGDYLTNIFLKTQKIVQKYMNETSSEDVEILQQEIESGMILTAPKNPLIKMIEIISLIEDLNGTSNLTECFGVGIEGVHLVSCKIDTESKKEKMANFIEDMEKNASEVLIALNQEAKSRNSSNTISSDQTNGTLEQILATKE
ncbi:MAG: hypothetical protein WCO84_02200 [bacterium]